MALHVDFLRADEHQCRVAGVDDWCASGGARSRLFPHFAFSAREFFQTRIDSALIDDDAFEVQPPREKQQLVCGRALRRLGIEAPLDGFEPNRKGGSSFIAVKKDKIWINASVGVFLHLFPTDPPVIFDWEYQIRYFRDGTDGKEEMQLGVVPNNKVWNPELDIISFNVELQ